MKALSVVWKIPDDRLKGFSNDTNGLIVVRDLCEHLGKTIESYLLLGKEYLPQMDLGHIHIVNSEKIAEQFADKSHLEIMKAVFENALDDIRPDIVHIHDCGDFCRICMKICIKRQIPYIFTAHSFIGKNQKISKVWIRDIFWQKEVYTIPNINIIAVGKGIASKIVKEYPNIKPKQLRVIQNGTDFKIEEKNIILKKQLGLDGRKILICAGKISNGKNQMQIVKAVQLLPQSIIEKICILFCGNDRLNGKLQKAIKDAKLENALKYIGVLNNFQMKKYYAISDGYIMSSISEGLSIAALEAIACGLPLIMFSDLECAMDLNNENVVCFAKERTDEALADAIEKWANKDWDKLTILKYAEYFSMERVANDYIDCYSRILNI